MMGIISHKSNEWLRWIEAVLNERFEQSLELSVIDELFELRLSGSEKSIKIGPVNHRFYSAGSDMPCAQWCPAGEGLVAPYDSIFIPGVDTITGRLIEEFSEGFIINYDLIGFVSWMLTRLEEVQNTEKDLYDRFQYEKSNAYLSGYAQRPVVDELLNILSQVIRRCWPNLVLRRNAYSVNVSHDVDRANTVGPSDFNIPIIVNGFRAVLVDILKKGDFSALRRPWESFRFDRLQDEQFNTFDWVMDVSEAHDLKSSFHFICSRTSISKDNSYDIRHKDMRKLLRRISNRDHEICLHPSFNSFLEPLQIKRETELLRTVLEEENIHQDKLGSRMHYLKWRHPDTLVALDAAGLDYDCTLAYSEQPGFRCGTCYEYPSYDPVANKRLRIRTRPLIAMDVSLLTKRKLDDDERTEIFSQFVEVRDACKKVNGQFTLLWHNCELFSEQRRDMYQALIGS